MRWSGYFSWFDGSSCSGLPARGEKEFFPPNKPSPSQSQVT